ncbi:glutaredoxin-like protein NrdH [Leuconostoc sp.]|uniref:glutaredoxin-like protein NrdH n=1 Tax=Leuconostoc sp. TaxID=1930076 RepID=UPI00257A3BAF|nr:glutaredoxin-like protein NrdH [Leuconostoc sp.]NLT85868.1 glutaredoxin-like protein NrdH [Leuconostoc sp.]
MEKVTIYTKYNCVQCKMTKNFLEAQGIAFKEVNIEEETQYVDELKANGYRQTPVVAIEGMPSFSGFRPDVLKKISA